MYLNSLTGTQRRQLIDTQQVFAAWRVAKDEHTRCFTGGMRWARRGNTDYLLRKNGKRETSLGARSPEREQAYDAFIEGRTENRDRLKHLEKRLAELAPVNVAMGLGRVLTIAAYILQIVRRRRTFRTTLVRHWHERVVCL